MAEPPASPSPPHRRRFPRWWRRALVTSRRVNLFLWLELIAAIALVVMLSSAYLALTHSGNPDEPLPSLQTTALLLGTLIPALALVVLGGRRLAIRRAGDIGHPSKGKIWLEVNGQRRQTGDLSEMIWSVPEIIAHLSGLFELKAGDLIFTGTPAGVAAVQRGDTMKGGIDGVGELTTKVG